MSAKANSKKARPNARKAGKRKAAERKPTKRGAARRKAARAGERPPSTNAIWETTEEALTCALDEDLRDAWRAIRAFGASLGDQRIYAAGRAIMFSRKVCYFFVRPKKTYLETVIFLPRRLSSPSFKSRPASSVRYAHSYRLVHADQVEGELTDALAEAYETCPAASPASSGV